MSKTEPEPPAVPLTRLDALIQEWREWQAREEREMDTTSLGSPDWYERHYTAIAVETARQMLGWVLDEYRPGPVR